MNAIDSATARTAEVDGASPMVGLLRILLLAEAVAGLVLAILLSLVAGEVGRAGGSPRSTEEAIRFAAGGSLLLAILAASASRGARRRRPWSWTLAAILQVAVAIGTGIAVFVIEWHPLFLAGFAAAALVMIVLSTASVRRALGQP